MVEVPCRWRVGARVFCFDCRYRPPALGFKISVLLHVSCFAVPALELSFRVTGESTGAFRPMRLLTQNRVHFENLSPKRLSLHLTATAEKPTSRYPSSERRSTIHPKPSDTASRYKVVSYSMPLLFFRCSVGGTISGKPQCSTIFSSFTRYRSM
jgi:hypothetical protein